MTMAAQIRPGSHAPCSNGQHRHDVPPRGGRCAFYSPGRPGDICGRTPVASYTNPRAKVYRTWRCAHHDSMVAQAEAAAQGYRREAVARG
jgi:hypothetical protein